MAISRKGRTDNLFSGFQTASTTAKPSLDEKRGEGIIIKEVKAESPNIMIPSALANMPDTEQKKVAPIKKVEDVIQEDTSFDTVEKGISSDKNEKVEDKPKTVKKAKGPVKRGRKKVRQEEYTRISCEIPLQLYEGLKDSLPYWHGSITNYLTHLIISDLNENYEKYVGSTVVEKITFKRK